LPLRVTQVVVVRTVAVMMVAAVVAVKAGVAVKVAVAAREAEAVRVVAVAKGAVSKSLKVVLLRSIWSVPGSLVSAACFFVPN
jgi:hypothetical protein